MILNFKKIHSTIPVFHHSSSPFHCLYTPHAVLCFDVWKPLNACPRPAGCIAYLVKFMLQVVKYKHHMILLGPKIVRCCKQHIVPLKIIHFVFIEWQILFYSIDRIEFSIQNTKIDTKCQFLYSE